MMRRCLFSFAAVLFASLLLFAACTDPGLCYEEYHPHSTGVTFRYEWPEGYVIDSTRADSMQVLAVRIINNKKHSMIVDATAPFHGHFVHNAPTSVEAWEEPDTIPEPEPIDSGSIIINTDPDDPNSGMIDPQEPDTTVVPPVPTPTPDTPIEQIIVDRFPLGTGAYKFFTMSTDTAEVTYSRVNEYMSSPGDGVQASDIMIAYRSYERGDSALREVGGTWTDYNPAFEYIQPEFKPIYADSVDITEVSGNQRVEVVFQPKRLTQHIDINFTIHKEAQGIPFVIDTVWAEISGIPSRAYLFTGHLYLAKTRKMKFNTEFLDGPDEEGRDSVRVHAGIDVLSIMNTAGPGYQTGPGILQLKIKAHAFRRLPDGTIDPRPRYRILMARTNLYNDLMRAQLIKYDENGQWAMRNGDDRELNVSTVYTIYGSNVLEADVNPNGINIWVESGEGGDSDLEL